MQISLTGKQLAEVALSTIRAALGTERYQYLSGPITGGSRLLAWHADEGRSLPASEFRAASLRAVVQPNIADLQVEAEHQRSVGRRTIEPGSFEADFEHWGQPEFLAFWDQVLKYHASSVRFMPGWEYSSGCAFEYYRATIYGLPCFDLDGTELFREAAMDRLSTAVDHILAAHDPLDLRDAPLAKLHASIAKWRELIMEARPLGTAERTSVQQPNANSTA